MNPGKHLGLRFLLRVLVGAGIFGFVVGYLIQAAADEYELVILTPYAAPVLGVAVGLVVAVVVYIIARRSLYQYVVNMRDKLANVGDLPFGIDDDLKLEDQAKTLYGLFEYEVSRLNDHRRRMHKLSDRARETLKKAKNREKAPLETAIMLIKNRLEEVSQVSRRLKQLEDWIDDTVAPVAEEEVNDLQLDDISQFDRLVDFQEEIESRLRKAAEKLKNLQKVTSPWEKGPGQLREATGQANSLIFEMAELFQKFPTPELPEKAEKLRRQTADWEELAEKIEKGLQTIDRNITNSIDTVEDLHSSACRAGEPLSIWEGVKEDINSVDNKVKQLRKMTGSHWIDSLNKQLRNMKTQAEWLDNSLRELLEEFEAEAQVVDELDSMAAELGELIDFERN